MAWSADLGGGSLDMVTVKNGVTGKAFTLPFGPLRLMDQSSGEPDKARDLVDQGLKDLPDLSAPALYAVGGIWRSFARVDMEEHNYPLHVLQQYTIPRGRALRLCKVLAGPVARIGAQDQGGLQAPRRSAALWRGGAGAAFDAGDIKDVVISAYGLREGLVLCQAVAGRPRQGSAAGIRHRRQ